MRLAAKGAVEVLYQHYRSHTHSSVVSRVSPVSDKVSRVGAVGDEEDLQRNVIILVRDTNRLTSCVWESVTRVGSRLRLPVGV